MKYLNDFKTFEGINGVNDYTEGDIVVIRYEITKGDPILTPVKIVTRYSPNSFLVSHKTDDSNIKNFPDLKIKLSQIVSRYKGIDDPANNTSLTQNPTIAPNLGGSVPGANGNQPTSDITQLPANQSMSNDISV